MRRANGRAARADGPGALEAAPPMRGLDGLTDPRMHLVGRHHGSHQRLPGNRAVFNQGKHRRQDRGTGMIARGQDAVGEVEHLRQGAVHERRDQRRQPTAMADRGRGSGRPGQVYVIFQTPVSGVMGKGDGTEHNREPIEKGHARSQPHRLRQSCIIERDSKFSERPRQHESSPDAVGLRVEFILCTAPQLDADDGTRAA